MSTPRDSKEEFIARPALPRSVVFAITCVTFSLFIIQLSHAGKIEIFPAYLVALILTAGSIILLSEHFPNASFLRLTREGFEIRELFKSRYYAWNDVRDFKPRRRFLGTMIEFTYIDPDSREPIAGALPVGYSISTVKLLQTMIAWHKRYNNIE